MGIDFKAHNALEQAICDRDCEAMVYAVAEGMELTILAPASNLGDECFTDEAVFAVLLLAANIEQIEMMANGWFWGHLKAGERMRKLVEEALTPLPRKPEENEKKLVKAIAFQESNEVIRLIKQENARFSGFAPELLTMLPELSQEAVLTLLRDGLSAKLKVIVWGILLKEAESPERLNGLTYAEVIKYANLMMKIIAGKAVSADEPWYPEN